MNFRFNLLFLILGLICFSLSNGVHVSDWYGGGGGGYRTLYSGDENAYITKVCLRTGSLLDQIQVFFSNGAYAGPYGGNGGGYNCYPSSGSLSRSNCITSINVRSGSLIDGIQFHTKGGSTSSWYGGHGGGYYVINKNNECLSSMNARTGSLVDALQFYFGNGRRSEIIPNPDDTVYPEPDGPDPIYDHNNNPISYYPPQEKPVGDIKFPNQYQYLFWLLVTLIILNLICLTYYCWNRNKIVKKYKIVSTESEVDEML